MNPNIERDVGIGTYLGEIPGLGGKLRREVQDFIVVERFKKPPVDHGGRFSIATVRVRNWETNRLIRKLSMELRIDRRSIGFAGTKDKRAITTQLMSFPVTMDRMLGLALGDVQILDVYRSNREITLGDLLGNRFEIVVSGIDMKREEVREIMERNRKLLGEKGGFLNYFGIQRFGAIRTTTHLVGESIVRKNFREAVLRYVGRPAEGESEDLKAARRMAEETDDWEEVLKVFPRTHTFERTMMGHLATHPGDFPGALRRLPKNLQLMFVHAYQSRFFNEMISRRVERGIPVDEAQIGDLVVALDGEGVPDRRRFIPVNEYNIRKVQKRMDEGKAYVTALLAGSDVEVAGGEQGDIEMEILAEAGIEPRSFIIRELPGISSRGIRREILAPVNDLSYEIREDSVKLRFELFKGSYATSFLREIMKVKDVTRY